MLEMSRLFFDHTRHKLWVRDLDTPVDVLAFSGSERLSEPFTYEIEFTTPDQDIAAERLLNRQARFTLHPIPGPWDMAMPGFPAKVLDPLRIVNGVITSYRRLSSSRDEARYVVTLQPRLARLARGKQTRLYQHKTVPEIVDQILRSRHDFLGQDFWFNLNREYPRRLQVMQYDESDLAFITRLLADIGIWYRFATDERLGIEVVEFHDDQCHYRWPATPLPCRPESGLTGKHDAVWNLQVRHDVVEQSIHFRAYDPRNSRNALDADVDQTRGIKTTYGEAYLYAEPYTELGDKFDQNEKLLSESGFFYARLRHERYLNAQTVLSGTSNSAKLVLAQVLDITGGAPNAFDRGAVITQLTLSAARDASLSVTFDAVPYLDRICYRPPLQPKPVIAGTLPARITSYNPRDLYSHIDREGRYKVNFLFDRDEWKQGEESLWLRLARPYAGATHGLHLPLICGTEVAIAFEQGDPDRPYIAHALHDDEHRDHVTLNRGDNRRNVLRTPANNKLRMEDARGQEHVKLSTEHSGKSQLNLGHLVDAQKKKRGEGFELRTDGWGAIRGGKGLFITADRQPKAQGDVLSMNAAVAQLEDAVKLVNTLARSALNSRALPADVAAQEDLKAALTGLKRVGLLASAPEGMAFTSGTDLQLSAANNLTLTAGESADISIAKRFSVAAGDAISLFARRLGLKLFAQKGPVEIEAQKDAMTLRSDSDMCLESINGEIVLNAKNGITLVSGGAYIKIANGSVEIGAPNRINLKNDRITWGGSASLDKALQPWTQEDPECLYPMKGAFRMLDQATGAPASYVPYRMTMPDGSTLHGVTDDQGRTEHGYGYGPDPISLEERPLPPANEALEEEEEEEEREEGITLRLGLFFDGTGNNMANAAATAQCRREDLEVYGERDLESIKSICTRYGFDGFTGSAFAQAPDNSYGNAPSNVVYLRELYPDNAATPMTAKSDIGYIKVYVEGIGTRSGGRDNVVIGQGLGRGETGVIARVSKAVGLVREQLSLFQQSNPGKSVNCVEVDIFGFSRGAAAARHCANEFLKPGCGIFNELLQPGRFGLVSGFDPAVGVSLNLIGLFDTVAAISSPERGDFSPANNANNGVNLYLPAGCARQVIQLGARDEKRFNFALNGVLDVYQQIDLPGVHSDIGGGYLPNAQERLWLAKPKRIEVASGQSVESHPQWLAMSAQADALRATGLQGDGSIEVKSWATADVHYRRDGKDLQAYWVTVMLERSVRGELALVALRVMRELGVRNGVPFDEISDTDERFKLPSELVAAADQIIRQVLAGSAVRLDAEQERLLRSRYIHQSAHWTPTKGVMLAKPTPDNSRNVYPDQPQKGYPQ